jgi:2-iminobutanoate/2-iminopropanoate deaminase
MLCRGHAWDGSGSLLYKSALLVQSLTPKRRQPSWDEPRRRGAGVPLREPIETTRVATLGLPYCQAVRYGNFIFVSGQVAIDPETRAPIAGGVREQTLRVLMNISTILNDAGTSIDLSLEAMCFLRTQDDFAAFNDAYREFFRGSGPPRTTVLAAVPLEPFLVEIKVIAGMPS